MKSQRPTYRRPVEIYFVLYLAALVLLLPDNDPASSSHSSLVSALLEMNFAISPEKDVLNCQLSADSTGGGILLLDSLNILYSVGNVRDVHYEFEIEDHTIQQRLRLDTRATPASLFRIREETEKGTVRFLWHPDLSERRNRTFTVHVKATAKPLIPSNLRDAAMREQLRNVLEKEETTVTATTQFIINIFVSDDQRLAQGRKIDTIMNAIPPQNLPPQIVINNGDFKLWTGQSNIETMPNQLWSTIVQLYGATTRDIGQPGVYPLDSRGSNDLRGGTAYLEKLENDKIFLAGRAPKSGIMTVRVTAKRTSDSRDATIDFTIRSVPIPDPILPSFMYAGQTYTFEPNLPNLTGQESKAILFDGTHERYVSQQGVKFSFKPELSDTGKTFRFVRILNGEQLDAMFTVKVSDYPLPQVLSIEKQGDALNITTRSYGISSNGSDNRVRLVIEQSSNLERPVELNGDYYSDSKDQSHIQIFQSKIKEPSKTVSITVHAEDMRGRKSRSDSY